MKTWVMYCKQRGLGVRESFRDRSIVFDAGESASYLYTLLNGNVEVVHTCEDGRSIVTKILTQGTFCGALELFGDMPYYLRQIRTLGHAEVLKVGDRQVRHALAQFPELAIHFLKDLSHNFAQSSRGEAASLMELDVKMARLLLAYGAVYGDMIDGALTLRLVRSQTDIARAVGSSERQVRRILHRWRDEGLVEKQGRHLVLKDLHHLVTLSGELANSLLHPVNAGNSIMGALTPHPKQDYGVVFSQ